MKGVSVWWYSLVLHQQLVFTSLQNFFYFTLTTVCSYVSWLRRSIYTHAVCHLLTSTCTSLCLGFFMVWCNKCWLVFIAPSAYKSLMWCCQPARWADGVDTQVCEFDKLRVRWEFQIDIIDVLTKILERFIIPVTSTSRWSSEVMFSENFVNVITWGQGNAGFLNWCHKCTLLGG